MLKRKDHIIGPTVSCGSGEVARHSGLHFAAGGEIDSKSYLYSVSVLFYHNGDLVFFPSDTPYLGLGAN